MFEFFNNLRKPGDAPGNRGIIIKPTVLDRDRIDTPEQFDKELAAGTPLMFCVEDPAGIFVSTVYLRRENSLIVFSSDEEYYLHFVYQLVMCEEQFEGMGADLFRTNPIVVADRNGIIDFSRVSGIRGPYRENITAMINSRS